MRGVKLFAASLAIAFVLGLLINAIVARAAPTIVQIFNGGTGTSTTPGYGKVLVGGLNGEYEFVATSTFNGGGSGTVSSVFGRTGAVTAQSGDYTTSLVPEGTNLYYTAARSLADFIANLAATTSVKSITTLPSLSLPYSQLTGTPTIPSKTSDLTNDSGFITSSVTTLPSLSLPYSQLTGVPAFDTFAYPFPGNATSTTLTFNNGLLSTASSTFNSTFHLPALSNGSLAVYGGLVGSYATTTFNSPLNYSNGAVTLSTSGTWSGNAGTATALSANGTNCSAGNYPLGVDASGNAENCTLANTGTVTSVTGTFPILSTGGNTPVISWGGLATTSNPTAGNLFYSNGTNGLVPISTSTPSIGTVLTYSGTLGNLIGGTSGTFGIANGAVTNAMLATQYLEALGSGYATTSVGTWQGITFSTTTLTKNGQTLGMTIVPSGGALTLTPTLTGTLDNAGLTNSTIGATSPNSTLSFGSAAALGSTFTGDLNLAHGNIWTASTTFTAGLNAITGTTTNATSTTLFAGTASTTNFYGAGLTGCNSASNALTWSAGTFGCNSITGGASFEWTPVGSYNATDTTLAFRNGFVTTASSTFAGNTGSATTTFTQGVSFKPNGNVSTSESAGGAINVNCTGTNDCMHIFSSNTSGAPLFDVDFTGATANTQPFRLESSATNQSSLNIQGGPDGLGVVKASALLHGNNSSSIFSADATTNSFNGMAYFAKCNSGTSTPCYDALDQSSNTLWRLDGNGNSTTTGLQEIDSLTASKIVRTDANRVLSTVTVGSGLAFDGTTLSATGIASNALGTTTPWTAGQLAEVVNNSTVMGVATTSLAFNGPFGGTSALGALVGGSNSTVNWWGLSTTSQPSSSNVLVSNGAAGVYGVATTSETCTYPVVCTAHAVLTGGGAITFNGLGTTSPFSANQFVYTNPAGLLVTAASSSLALPNSALTNSSITVNGTTFNLGDSKTITAASSTLLSNNNTFSGTDLFTNAASDFSGTWQTFSPSHFQTALGFTAVPNTRAINTTWPIQGGGDLSADRTLTFAGLATTSPWTTGNLAYAVDNNHLTTVATGTISAGSTAITVTAGRAAIGGALAIDCAAASGSQNGCLSSTDWGTFNSKVTALGTGFSTTTTANISLSTSTQTFDGVTFAEKITRDTTGDLTFTPNITGNFNSLSHGSTLTGTSYNASAAVSNWDIDLTHANTWTGTQTFGNASSTLFSTSYASSTQYFGANLASCNGASNALTWNAGVFGCNSIASGSGVWPFTTTDTNYGVAVQSTTTPEWFKVPASGSVSFMASSTAVIDDLTISSTTATSTIANALQFGNTVRDNMIFGNCGGRVWGSSVTTGGCVNLDGGTTNTGAELVITDNNTSTGRGLVVDRRGAGSTGEAIFASSTATGASTVGIIGAPTNKGILKITHSGTGTGFSNAFGVSIDLLNCTDCGGLFIDRTGGAGTGNLLSLRDGGTHRLDLTAGGLLGIDTSGPTYNLDVTGNGHFTTLVDADHFIATSTTALSSFPNASTTAFTAASYFQLPTAASFSNFSSGTLSFDTSSGDLVMGTTTATTGVLIGSATSTLYSFTVASTSVAFTSGGHFLMPVKSHAMVVTGIICNIENGTSQVINLSNSAGTSDTNSVTCTTTSNEYAITTNNTWAGFAQPRIEFGTKTGSPDYLDITVLGYQKSD